MYRVNQLTKHCEIFCKRSVSCNPLTKYYISQINFDVIHLMKRRTKLFFFLNVPPVYSITKNWGIRPHFIVTISNVVDLGVFTWRNFPNDINLISSNQSFSFVLLRQYFTPTHPFPPFDHCTRLKLIGCCGRGKTCVFTKIVDFPLPFWTLVRST